MSLVVTDVMMPVMDGLKLARALRQLDPAIRVIASSGLDPAGVPAELAAGFIAEFLHKPYETRALLAAVARQLKAAAGSDACRPMTPGPHLPPAPIPGHFRP